MPKEFLLLALGVVSFPCVERDVRPTIHDAHGTVLDLLGYQGPSIRKDDEEAQEEDPAGAGCVEVRCQVRPLQCLFDTCAVALSTYSPLSPSHLNALHI